MRNFHKAKSFFPLQSKTEGLRGIDILFGKNGKRCVTLFPISLRILWIFFSIVDFLTDFLFVVVILRENEWLLFSLLLNLLKCTHMPFRGMLNPQLSWGL